MDMEKVRIEVGVGVNTQCINIRKEVFTKEQGLPDGADEIDLSATYLLVHVAGEAEPVATCRIFMTSEANSCMVGRFAVKRNWRKMGLGRQLLARAESEAKRLGATKMVVHAQEQAEGFYASAGYTSTGIRDVEVGCPHVWMERLL